MHRNDFRHVIPLSVQWGDMDALGHVNNATYFRYVESGRIAYFDAIVEGDPSIWGGQGPILADIQCTFLSQLKYPAELEVATRTSRLGGKSLTVQAAIFVKGQESPAATSSAAVVWFDYSQQTAVRVPDGIRERITSYEVVAPS